LLLSCSIPNMSSVFVEKWSGTDGERALNFSHLVFFNQHHSVCVCVCVCVFKDYFKHTDIHISLSISLCLSHTHTVTLCIVTPSCIPSCTLHLAPCVFPNESGCRGNAVQALPDDDVCAPPRDRRPTRQTQFQPCTVFIYVFYTGSVEAAASVFMGCSLCFWLNIDDDARRQWAAPFRRDWRRRLPCFPHVCIPLNAVKI